MAKEKYIHHPELMCAIVSIEYNFHQRELLVYMNGSSCTYMSGVIEYAKRLDRYVKQIQTFCDGKPDTCYVLVNRTWKAQTFNTVKY
jgi:hypothetical protein